MFLNNFSLAKFQLTISPTDKIILPIYKGSTFRGGFGPAFKRVIYISSNKDCSECLLKEKCIYSYVFETPPPKDTTIMRKYPYAPHVEIIDPNKKGLRNTLPLPPPIKGGELKENIYY